MTRIKHIFLHLLLEVIPVMMAVAPAMAQNTVYAGQTSALGVTEVPGDTYAWELYTDNTTLNFATEPGNCPPGDAYFVNGNTGPSVIVMWLTQGNYYYKVTASQNGCTMNLKIGMITVLNDPPTAVIEPALPICAGDSAHLTVTLTGIAPWSFTLTDGVSSFAFANITSSPAAITVPVIPSGTTTYWITEVTDAHITNTTPFSQVVQVVNPKPVNSKIYRYRK